MCVCVCVCVFVSIYVALIVTSSFVYLVNLCLGAWVEKVVYSSQSQKINFSDNLNLM